MSNQSSNSRPLAPAPSPSVGPSEDSAGSPGATTNQYAAGIKRASTACQSCKQIKRKCDQAQPCSNCRKSHTLCVYNEAEDGRRRAARKRTVESLELKRDALDSILESLRMSDDKQVQALVQLIKANAPLDDIVRYATTHARDLKEDRLQNIVTIVNGQPRRTVFSVIDLCDTPLVRVPAKPWTNATDDDELVSHLISIFFTWFHVAYPIVDKSLFLSDMAAGKLECQFCSPLLVNAMLMAACHFSDHPRACQIPSDANTRGRHFLEEATNLWHGQENSPTLLNIQALAILTVPLTLVGKDRLSFSYLTQINTMQQELSFKTAQNEARGLELISPETKRSQGLTSWTTFLLAVGYGSAFMKASEVMLPNKTSPLHHPSLEKNMVWFPYPQQSPEVLVPSQDLYAAHCDLHKIGLDIQKIHFGSEPTTQRQEVNLLDQTLHNWFQALPSSLVLPLDTSIINPPIMDLHLTYHWFRLTLFTFIKTSQSTPVTPPDLVDPVQKEARSQTIQSAKAIAQLCNLYARDFGLKQPTMWMPQTAMSAAHSIVDTLSDPVQGPVLQETFHELCLVVIAASQRWLVMKAHVRMLFVTVQERGQTLPKKTRDLLKFVALDKWGESDHLRFASAVYPNYSLAKDEDPRLAAMGDLLEKWATLQLSGEQEEDIL